MPEDSNQNQINFTPEMVRQFISMAEAVVNLQNRVNELSNPVVTDTHDTRALDPEPFYGDHSKLRDFISQVRLVIQAQPSCFVTER